MDNGLPMFEVSKWSCDLRVPSPMGSTPDKKSVQNSTASSIKSLSAIQPYGRYLFLTESLMTFMNLSKGYIHRRYIGPQSLTSLTMCTVR